MGFAGAGGNEPLYVIVVVGLEVEVEVEVEVERMAGAVFEDGNKLMRSSFFLTSFSSSESTNSLERPL